MTVFGNCVLLHEVKLGSLEWALTPQDWIPHKGGKLDRAWHREKVSKDEDGDGVLLQPRHLADSRDHQEGERPPQILPGALGRTGAHPQRDLRLPASRKDHVVLAV